MLVALKTHFKFSAIFWLPSLLSRLFEFQILFLSVVVPYCDLLIHETDHMCGSDNLARQGCAYSR